VAGVRLIYGELTGKVTRFIRNSSLRSKMSILIRDTGILRTQRGKGRDVEQMQEPHSTDIEINRVFKEMGLETGEQRDKMLAQDPNIRLTPPVRYVIRLSNSSQPAPPAR
jgi:hypothetical protein